MLRELLLRLLGDGSLNNIFNNPFLPWGLNNKIYLGQSLLPEVTVTENAFRYYRQQFKTIVANAGTRHNAAQMKRGTASQGMMFELGYSDVASEFTGPDYDAFLQIVRQTSGQNLSMQQLVTLTNWMTKTLVLPLVEHNEKNRWLAICNASLTVTGDNGFSNTITYPNPSGHRFAAGGQWTNNSYDPLEDIIDAKQVLENKGKVVKHVIWSSQAASKFRGNTKIRERCGGISFASGVLTGVPGSASASAIVDLFEREDLPAPISYNHLYHTDSGTDWFLPRNKVVLIATSGRDEQIDLGDTEPMVLNDTLGICAMGIPSSTDGTPGRKFHLEEKTSKPPQIYGEAWQASLPAITEHESIVVISLDSDTFTSAPVAETVSI